MKYEIVKYIVGPNGHGMFNKGDIVKCYLICHFEICYSLLYSPKDKDGCGCLFVAKRVGDLDNDKDIFYKELSEQSMYLNDPDLPWLKSCKPIKQEDTEVEKAIKLLKQNGFNIKKK